MKVVLFRMWKEDDAVLAFEWVLLVTLLTIGIVGGVAAARDAIIDELGDVAEAMLSVDQSYSIENPLAIIVHTESTLSAAGNSEFIDAMSYIDCERTSLPFGQGADGAIEDTDS